MRRIHRTGQRHRKNFSEGIVNRAIAAAPTGHAKLIEADAYLFDIDGTLFNSRDGVHYQAFCRTLVEAYGVEPRSMVYRSTAIPISAFCARPSRAPANLAASRDYCRARWSFCKANLRRAPGNFFLSSAPSSVN